MALNITTRAGNQQGKSYTGIAFLFLLTKNFKTAAYLIFAAFIRKIILFRYCVCMKPTRFLLTGACVPGMFTLFSQPDFSVADVSAAKIDVPKDLDIQAFYTKVLNTGATEEQLHQPAQQQVCRHKRF